MAGTSGEKMDWIYNEESAKPKSEDYLLGKAIDANYERGTLGQINAVEYGNYFSPQFTMLQKFSKCEVKAARCGNLAIFLPLRFSMKSTLAHFTVSKTAIETLFEALNLYFCEFVHFLGQLYQNSNSRVSKSVKMADFENQTLPKLISLII